MQNEKHPPFGCHSLVVRGSVPKKYHGRGRGDDLSGTTVYGHVDFRAGTANFHLVSAVGLAPCGERAQYVTQQDRQQECPCPQQHALVWLAHKRDEKQPEA